MEPDSQAALSQAGAKMRRLLASTLSLLLINGSASAQTSIEKMIAETDPAIQLQISKVYGFHLDPSDAESEVHVLEELQQLKDFTQEKDEIVKQLAIFVATTASEEDMHIFVAGRMLEFLEVSPRIPIRVLAPYLDSENKKLRDFARGWFHAHDSHARVHGKPPLGSVNYHEYMEYVRSNLARNEEIPDGFIRYIYEKNPGKALLVFAYANRHGEVGARLLEIHQALETRQQAQKRTPEEMRQLQAKKLQDRLRRSESKQRLWEILFAEHTISNAIWLKENDLYPHRFQGTIPEARVQVQALAKKEWWARLYVVYIMRQHPELRLDEVLQKLKDDSNDLVREAAQATQ
jgi:hypothetical protein